PPPPSQELPSTSQVLPTPPPSPIAHPPSPQQPQPLKPLHDAKISMDLLYTLLETCTTLTRRVEHLEQDKIAQTLEITKLKQMVKKLEMRNKLKVSKLRRLKRVGTAQRVDTSEDTVTDDVSKQGRIIANIDADEDVTLKDVTDIAKEVAVDAEIEVNADVQGRQAESQAQIYQIHLEHADKVLSMQDDEVEPAKLQEVVEAVTTAKLMTEVVTAASATITAATTLITTVVITTAPSAARRRKGVVIRDPKDTVTPSIITHSEPKSKDKGKGIMVEDPKPIKKQAQIKQDEAYARELKAELNKKINWDDVIDQVQRKEKEDNDKFNSNVDFLKKTREQMEEEDIKALKRASESQAEKAAKKQKLDEEPKNFSDDFLLTTLTYMFEKHDVQAQVWKNQRTVHGLEKVKCWRLLESCGVHIITFTTTQMILLVERRYPLTRFTLDQMLNNIRLEVEEESEVSLELLRFVVQIVLWSLDFGCSKHMTGDRSQLTNFVHKFLVTAKFSNDHVAKIMGYGDYNIRNVTISRDHICSACAMGKSKKKSHKPKSKDTNQEKLYLLHMDLCGLMRVKSVNGKKYILVNVDDYSRFTWVKCLRSKDEAPYFIIKFLKMIQVRIKQNGVIERRNRTLIEAARIMLIYAQALLFLWAEAVATACYTQNQSIVQLRHGKTPYELLLNKLPDLSFLYVFGTLCYLTNDSENLGKLQPKANIRIFIGYAPTKKAFQIYNRRTRRIVETIHVDFDELTAMASEQSSLGPALHEMTPATISSGLVPKPTSSTSYVPPSRNDWDLLFQPMFDELLTPPPSVDPSPPEVIALIADVIPPEQAESTDSPSSTTVDQDALSPSKSQTTPETQPPIISQDVEDDNHDIAVAHMRNDPLFGMPIPEVGSDQSSSMVSSHTIVHPDHQISQHNSK
nr:hypothetical protein [Tanacetum cinerariifolium]